MRATRLSLFTSGLLALFLSAAPAKTPEGVTYNTVEVEGLDIFYREAGDRENPTVLLLHGFPTSSHMFRDLIPQLAERYHVVAPDYPGYGYSSAPARETFTYTFDNLASVIEDFTEELELKEYSLYVQDYGAPVGYRLAAKHPDRVSTITVQNGNAYVEGLPDEFWGPIKKYWADPSQENREALRPFLKLDATKWQWTHGTRNPAAISPDTWTLDQHFLDRPGNQEIQLDLFLSYGTNPPLYPRWQEYFRQHQPPVLIVWGRNDQIFPAAGAHPYLKDLPNAEFHLLNTGHFALEEDSETIGRLMLDFLDRNVER
ncbi:MAG: alpha/beta hydrolase [Candidatus Sumerlaeia bacterium]|nr:alpha/beta hydrolase [Candidatus Sumerlaeia bacterium]